MQLDIRVTVVAVLLSALATFYFTNNQKTKIETVEKEVIKNNIVTVTREVVNKDGSKTIETVVTDKTQLNATKKETKVMAVVPNYLLNGSYGKDLNNNKDIYSLSIQKRVLPSVLAGVSINTEKQIGLVVGVEF